MLALITRRVQLGLQLRVPVASVGATAATERVHATRCRLSVPHASALLRQVALVVALHLNSLRLQSRLERGRLSCRNVLDRRE